MVDYPVYMQTIHHYFLDGDTDGAGEPDTTGGLVLQIDTAVAANPYTGLTASDPAAYVTAMATSVTNFTAVVAALNPHTDFDTYFAAAVAEIDLLILPDSYISARTYAHATALDTEINTKVLPRFEAGMREINAVMTSAFAIGRAIIEMDRNDKVDKFMADMRFQADVKRSDMVMSATGEMIRMLIQKTEYSRVLAALEHDSARLSISALNDYVSEGKAMAADLARWPLEVYKYGANMLASVSGGTTSATPTDGNKTARMLGAGLSGALAGIQISNALGGGSTEAGFGAVLGGLAAIAGGF